MSLHQNDKTYFYLKVSNGVSAPGGTAHTGGYGDANDGNVSGLSSVQNQVHMVIRNNPTAEGASVESVCKQIRGVPEKAIRYSKIAQGFLPYFLKGP